MRLVLLGLNTDRERLEAIAARLGRFGHEASFQVFGSDVEETESNVQDVPIESSEFAWVLYCWTFASIGKAGRAFQASAIARKQAGDYHGLICDPVTVPQPILGATDFRIDPTDTEISDKAIESLSREITRQLSGPTMSPRALLEWIARQIGYLASQIRTLSKRQVTILKWTVDIVIFYYIVGIFGIIGGSIGIYDHVMKQPSAEQQTAWKVIVNGDACEAFTDYIRRYGIEAPYSRDAEYRTDHPTLVDDGTEEEAISLRFEIPPSEKPFPSFDAGARDIQSRAARQAAVECAIPFSTLGDSHRSPTAQLDGEPDCRKTDAGYFCRATAIAQCVTAKPRKRKTCPSP